LQDKVWGGYTLVVTYDQQFDPHEAELVIGGLDCVGVERQTGTIAVTSAASLQIQEKNSAVKTNTIPTALATVLDRIDDAELAGPDRALITRPVLLAYRFAGRDCSLSLGVTRFEELPVLDAAADRTQLTTVLTEDGQLLTQASFMVKNNDRQFQTFTLPTDAKFWSCYLDNTPIKPERNEGKLLVPLPRRTNRDVAFAVDLVYVQKIDSLKSRWLSPLALGAPATDMQTTYAEWELYAPANYRLDHFAGTMTVARGTTYGLRDAWLEFARFYDMLWRHAAPLTFGFGVCLLLAAGIVVAIRRGWNGLLSVLAVLVVFGLLAGMLLPALSSARGKARRSASMSNLRQVGLGIAQFAGDHAGQMPASLDEIKGFVGSEKVFVDVDTGEQFHYVGAGRKWQEGGGDTVVAYSQQAGVGGNVLYSDGHVAWVNSDNLDPLLSRTVNEIPPATLAALPTAPSDSGAEQPAGESSSMLGVRTGSALGMLSGINADPSSTVAINGNASDILVLGNGPINRRSEHRLGLLAGNGSTTFSAGLISGGGAGGGGNVSSVGGFGGRAHSAMVSGIRPLRIDIPKTGQRFVFTKVLNVRGEPLNIRARALEQAVYQTGRGAVQALALVVGLILAVWQWRRARPCSLTLTVGLALVISAVVSLLLAYRLLHVAMILAVPVIGCVILVWLVRRLWRRQKTEDRSQKSEVRSQENGNDGQKTEDRSQKSEVRSQENGNDRPKTDGGFIPPVVMALLLSLFASGITQAAPLTHAVVSTVVAPADISILSARYTGTVRALDAKEAARAGQFEAVIELNTTRDNQTVRLFGEEIAVEEFAATPAAVKLMRDGQSVGALVPRKGLATVRVKYLVKPTGDVARRQVAFRIPAALVSRVAVTLDEPEAQVEVPTAISFKTTSVGQQTTVEAVLGNTDRVELNWTPRMKRAAEVATTVFCQNAALVNFAGGVVNVRALLDYQVTQGELRQIRVAIPDGQRLMRVEGDSIRTWKLVGQTLNVELMKGVAPSYRLTVETEQVATLGKEPVLGTVPPEKLANLIPVLKVEIPHALEVKRETGLVALKTADELSVSVAEQQDLQKVDVEEFTRVASGTSVASAYRFLKSDFKLAVRVEPVQPQIEALVRNQARVTTEQIGLLAVVDYTIKRAGVFTLRLALPAGYRVERVTGLKIAQWVEKTGTLDVTLKERTTGAYNLSIELVKLLPALPKSLEITGVQPLDTAKLSGFVSVAAEEGVQVKSESFDGLTEVPATLIGGLPSGGSVLGFKLIAGEQPVWKLSVATEKIGSWVRAEVVNKVTLSETLVTGRSVIRYEIQNAPTKEFRVRVPANFRNVEVTGANIRRKDHDEPSGEWRLELQNKVRGSYTVTVTWDRPWDVKSGALEVTGVEAPGVEREIGWVVIVAPARLEIKKQATTTDMLPSDARDLPDWAERTTEPPVLAYRYLRPGFKLGLTTQRFEEAEVLQALIDNVRLVTVVAEDGQMMTEMTLAVRNNARQYLEIALPPGTTNVWSAFVAGQPVRPCVRAGKLLVPMERRSGDTPVTVEVTYVGSEHFPRGRGGVSLASPALDVPLKDAHWELYLPPDYTYGEFAGSMQRAAAAVGGRSTMTVTVNGQAAPVSNVAQADAPVVRSYALSDYRQEESKKEEAKDKETETILYNARQQLAVGDLAGANTYVNMARGKGNAQGKAEFKRLEKDIKHGQANQLIVLNGLLGMQQGQVSAQSVGGTWQSGGQINTDDKGAGNAAVPQKLINQAYQPRYDEDAAEQQVTKVQAAQEVTVAKTVPLRLNLPKRGVYLTFTQVLQTEPGKPMTVDFRASNDRAASLPVQIAVGVVGLAALWLVVKLVLRKQNMTVKGN